MDLCVELLAVALEGELEFVCLNGSREIFLAVGILVDFLSVHCHEFVTLADVDFLLVGRGVGEDLGYLVGRGVVEDDAGGICADPGLLLFFSSGRSESEVG